MTIRTRTVLVGAATILAVTGCTSGTTSQDADGKPSSSQSSSPAASESYQISTVTIRQIFSSSGFDPEAFGTPQEMIDAIYPGISASPGCLAVLGVGAEDPDANTVFGPSNDKTLTAQFSSFTAPADSYYATLSDHADDCIANPQVTFQGTAVEATVERREIHDTAFELTLTATLMGSEVSMIAKVEQLEENVISVVGWDPRTNEDHVPRATGMLVEKASSARSERINEVG